MVRRGGPEEEMIRLAQQGKIETILGHKESVELSDLFTLQIPLVVLPPPPPPSRVFLFEGAPGGGKSTLAFHICHQWAQDTSWLERFDVVVLAYLRDEAIQKANTLTDILPSHISNTSNIQTIVSLIQASYGCRVLFIFDGWDEFPPDLMNESLVSTIIRQPHKLSLHLSTVLITSRPVSSGSLLHIADRRIEILGFTQHQIHKYIEKALDGNSTHIQKLVQHLEEHPVIEGYCYVPLHVAILVHIFLTMKGALPTTLHELFCSLVLCCIVREHATHEPDTILPELSSLDDLPDDLKSKLSNLSTLAYNGVMQDKVVFYPRDLKASHLPTVLPSLGLLQAVEGLTLCSKSFSYNFLHLSVQELLAAYNISQMDPSEQVKVFKELFESSRFQAVLHYSCGFTKLANLEIQTFISSFQTRKSSIKDLLPLLHCFFEAQQPSLCQLVDHRFIPNEQQKFNSKDLSPVDFLAIGYFITSLLSTSTGNTLTIHLVVDGIDDHRLKMLLNELSKYPVGGIPTSAGALLLELCAPSITRTGISYIASCLKKSSAISEIKLSNGNFHCDDDVLLSIAEALQTNTSLTNLSLRSTGLYYIKQNGSALTKMLQVNKSLTHLDLSLNNFSDSGACCIFDGLQHNNTLVYLNLSSSGIQIINTDAARSLTKMLQVNKSLTHLDLSNYLHLCFRTISHQIISCIFEGLEHNTMLRYLNIRGVSDITDTDAEHIARALKSNYSLQTLNISECRFLHHNGIPLILESLMSNSTLQTLYISDIDSETLSTFTRAREAKNMPPITFVLSGSNCRERKRRAATYNQLCPVFRKSERFDLEDETKQILAECSLVNGEGEHIIFMSLCCCQW